MRQGSTGLQRGVLGRKHSFVALHYGKREHSSYSQTLNVAIPLIFSLFAVNKHNNDYAASEF